MCVAAWRIGSVTAPTSPPSVLTSSHAVSVQIAISLTEFDRRHRICY